jgi:hypothetical protein
MATGRARSVGLTMLFACTACAETSSSSAPKTSSNAAARDAGWVAIAVGAEAALVAMGTSALMLHNKSVRDADCDAQKSCSQAGLDANSQLSALSGWNAGAWTVAALGLGAGTFLVLSNPPPKEPRTSISISPLGVRSDF